MVTGTRAFPGISKMALALLLSLCLLLPSALAGGIVCEALPKDLCAFAISSSSKRCLLESTHKGGRTEYQCQTSEVVVEQMSNWIETDDCVKACDVDRNTVGISSDSLLEPQFTAKLCSPACYQNCPNIIDLYFNLAAGEGVLLPDLCEARRANPRRAMMQLLSSGVTPDPVARSVVGRPGSSGAASPTAAAPASAPAPAPDSF